MKKYINIVFTIFLCCTFLILFLTGPKIKLMSAEDLDIYVGIASGIKKNGEGDIVYVSTTISNMYKEDESTESLVNPGAGTTIGKTRGARQKKIGKQFFLGLTKLYLLDEEHARYGIRPYMDILFRNPVVNDNAFLVVNKGDGQEYFNYTMPGYDNSAEYISNILKNSVSYNFFKEEYTFRNAALSMDAEGKNIVCPYIEMNAEGIKITGTAIFKKEKLGAVLDINDTKVMNMLREDKVKGILTLQKDSEGYVNYEAKSKRKIKCNRTGDKYTFIIDLNLDGEIVNNKLYKEMAEKIDVTEKLEEDMAKKVEEMCYSFLDKMKNQYKLDCLQLGWMAAAKYGRDTGVDWNEVISNSDIKVNVKVHVRALGRGQY